MGLGNIIGNMLGQGTSSQSQNRLRTGAENAERGGGIEQMLGSLMRGSGTSGTGGGGLAQRASDFLGKEQAGGMSGAKIGGLGAAAGALFGGGLGGAAKGGAMAILGTLALKAWRDHQAQQGGTATDAEASPDEVQALTGPDAERLVLRAMIGAAQVDGHVNEAEMEKILGRMHDDEVTEEERRAAREEVQRPVDVEQLGAQVSRPEVATEVYLAALLAVDIDTEAERDYFRRLAKALRLDADVVSRLHRMTGAPNLSSS
ncbi:MAG TPA: tellurite resistance TerB family protein [Saliniramus sp.]|nr:tellurite resistance TerB family protein [Saliniramus sp.]